MIDETQKLGMKLGEMIDETQKLGMKLGEMIDELAKLMDEKPSMVAMAIYLILREQEEQKEGSE